MKTITIKVEEKTERSFEVALPHYTKCLLGGKTWRIAKIFSPEKCIVVSNGSFIGVDISPSSTALGSDMIEATEQEFEALLSSVNADLLLIGYGTKSGSGLIN